MVEVSVVMDAAAGVAPGKAELGVTGQGGKTAASFFAVLAARMAPLGEGAGASWGAWSATEAASGLPVVDAADEAALDPAAYPALPQAMTGQPEAARGPMPVAASILPVAENSPLPASTSATLPGTLAGIGPASASGQMAADDTPIEPAPPPAAILPETAAARSEPPRHMAEIVARAANPAADVAAKGQVLPQPSVANAAVQLASSAPLSTESVVDALDAVSASAAPGQSAASSLAPTTGNAPTDPAMSRLFDVQPRQFEGRVNVAIEAPFRSPAFASELGEKIVWLAGRHAQFAELSLNPPHLGTLEIRLSLSGGEAVAQFFSASASVRDALETAMPRLRELMAQAGINLGEAQVRDEAFARDEAARGDLRTAAGASTLAAEEMVARVQPMRGMGLVDLYV